MKRLIFPLLSLVCTIPLCAQGAAAGKAARAAVYLACKENPEEAFSLGAFLIDLFLMCIPIAIVAGIVCMILKSVFELKKEDTRDAFFVIAGILLVICLLVYFVG